MPRPAALSDTLRELLQPLNLAALVAWLAIGLSLRLVAPDRLPLAWSLLVAFLLAFLAHGLLAERRTYLRNSLLLLELAVALVLIWLFPRPNTTQILLVIWTAQLAMSWPPRWVLAAVLLADTVYYLSLRNAGWNAPLLVTSLNAGFQMFAGLCAYYARSAERTRDQLVLVNADLLATRALLADSARDAERVRVARELHDVAGHKLTAMTLNLRALAADPAFADRSEVRVSQQLASELLGDIRDVVQALRDSRGLDLATALRALAAPLPKPALALSIAPDLQVTDPATAETILRIVQEALTNSARHADADVVRVALRRDGALLRLEIEDDGYVHGALREGNGLSGMRERINASGGSLAFDITPRGALRIAASLPALQPGHGRGMTAAPSPAVIAGARP